jgi:C-terminal processing protease CtpA/Prc
MPNSTRISTLILLSCLLESARAQPSSDSYRQAEAAYSRKQFVNAAALFEHAFDAGYQLPEILYRAASCDALAGDKSKAFACLDRMVASGYADASSIRDDSDLLSLHEDPRWQAVLDGLEKNQSRYREQEAGLWNAPSLASSFKPQLTEDERIGGLSKLWSEVKYNFASPERLIQIDWESLYVSYLPKVRAAKSTYEYYRLLEELCAKVGDSHTNVYHPRELVGSVGIHTRLIEDRLLVIDVWDPELRSQKIVAGMEIVEIDGEPARRYGDRNVAPYQSASTRQDLEVRTFEYFLLAGPSHEPVRLTLEAASGERLTATVRRKSFDELGPLAPKPPGFEFRVLSGNVGYVALNSFEDASVAGEFLAAFGEIAKTEALILDIRNNGGGNSGVGMRILATLIDKPEPLTPWQTRDYRPIFRAWGRPVGMLSLPGFDLAPDDELHYSKPVIVLTSPRTFSAAEDFLVAFDQSRRGTIVGEPSAGSTGQPLSFKLPGGGSGRVCTWRGTYADGKEFLGVGVQPQKRVVPTLRDFRAWKDTVLDAALAGLH